MFCLFCLFCSIIVVTTQFLSPALHKNFSEADFDFKVCVPAAGTEEPGGGEGGVTDRTPTCHMVCGLSALVFQVWNSFFSLTVLYINQPSLQLETLGPAKRKKVLDK